jgi:hypothetical protein
LATKLEIGSGSSSKGRVLRAATSEQGFFRTGVMLLRKHGKAFAWQMLSGKVCI